MEGVTIRSATVADAATLSALAFRSKAHWGYSLEFMAACKDELTYSGDTISAPHFRFFVFERRNEIVAFYALELLNEAEAELDALFVDPAHIGSGLGKHMMDHCRILASQLGLSTITIQGDPNAEGFYFAMGAKAAGYRESASVVGRQLPLFTISI